MCMTKRMKKGAKIILAPFYEFTLILFDFHNQRVNFMFIIHLGTILKSLSHSRSMFLREFHISYPLLATRDSHLSFPSPYHHTAYTYPLNSIHSTENFLLPKIK